jgi:hypothetical protein
LAARSASTSPEVTGTALTSTIAKRLRTKTSARLQLFVLPGRLITILPIYITLQSASPKQTPAPVRPFIQGSREM